MGKIYFTQILIALFATGATAQSPAEAAKVKFDKIEIALAGQKISVEAADTPEKHRVGLMYREKLPPQGGMLFVFEDTAPRIFWMKNTYVALSIGFFDQEGKLLNVHEMQPQATMMQEDFPRYPSLGAARFALEMNSGWFARHKIKKGAQLKLISKKTSPLVQEAFKAPPSGP